MRNAIACNNCARPVSTAFTVHENRLLRIQEREDRVYLRISRRDDPFHGHVHITHTNRRYQSGFCFWRVLVSPAQIDDGPDTELRKAMPALCRGLATAKNVLINLTEVWNARRTEIGRPGWK